MKRILLLSLIFTVSLSYPCYAKDYSEETKRLMQEAGLGQEYTVDEIMARQEALKSEQANNSTPTTQNSQNKANSTTTKRIKGGFDEYRVTPGQGQQSTSITDTNDGLHIYSNDYEDPTGYSKYSYDEFSIGGKDTPSNDGYGTNGFDELHIDPYYRKNVWKPDHKVLRIGIDEYRLPSDF